MTASTTQNGQAPRKARDLRLDFFRGMAMFIILLAHTEGNPWTLWIPARFGFSDATEIFVFCSGMASAIAFGAVFVKRSWWLGTARIAFRIWQVYWAHIGVFIVTALLMVAIDRSGVGEAGKVYTNWWPVSGLFDRTGETLFGLFTLTYIPGLFDILPMYLVILGMVPVVMALYRAGGREVAFLFIAVVWLLATLAGYARAAGDADLTLVQQALVRVGEAFSWMNLPSVPWEENATWFFNPFGWQLVFFTGFSFAMGWIPAPPIRRGLVWLAVAVIVLSLPFAWHKVYQYYTGYLPGEWGGAFFWDAQEWLGPILWKTWVGGWRYVHFLAVAYLAFAAVGPMGIRLTTGWRGIERTPETRRIIRIAMGAVLIATAPYAYVDEIKWFLPSLDRWLIGWVPLFPGRYIGVLQLVHLAALVTFVWHSIGDRRRRWLVGDAFLAAVPVIRKVGTQSLAVFLVSIVLSRFSGWWMDAWSDWLLRQGPGYFTPRDVWMVGCVNIVGFGILIGTAYAVSWFKSQPWRERPAQNAAATVEPRAAGRPNTVPAE